MRKTLSRLSLFVVVFTFLTGLVGGQISQAQEPEFERGTVTSGETFVAEASGSALVHGVSETGLYIVRLSEPALASYRGGVSGLAPTSPEVTGKAKLDTSSPDVLAYISYLTQKQAEFVSTVEQSLGRQMEVVYNYVGVLNGLAIRASYEEANEIATLPGVAAVYGDTLRELNTDVGPIHIGAPAIWNGDTGSGFATRGEGIVIGIIDSGINFFHPSFYAMDGGGYIHTNPYGDGVFKGWCATHAGYCNNKLIAAYNFFTPGQPPVDTDGHGSHTASTAGGNAHTASFSIGTTDYNIPIQGVAPRANIVAYKVCDPGCPGSASIASVNSAILDDQVDVLNYSISGSDFPWTDPVEL
ncbi:MAG TPA: hypothetical protein DCY35_05120, partial [Prolixibacteraceae bacterium]|nr:hypothetical protein [Prolixibacteraceae bacterium]